MVAVAYIAELWRYPVKSMRGEQVDTLDLRPDGIAHDRRYAFESSAAPQGKPLLTGRERAAMLLYKASVRGGRTFVRTPQDAEFTIVDPALLQTMQAAFSPAGTLRVIHSTRPLTDVRPVALLSQQTIATLGRELGHPVDARRFRANIILSMPSAGPDAFPEDAFVGHTLRLGATAKLRVTERDPRCRIVILDPETAQPDPAIMKDLDRHHQGRLGIYATTVTSGTLRVGDPVCLA